MQNTHTLVYGSSDDIIEIEGQVEGEYNNYTLAKRGISFECSDETKGIITYDGDWLIKMENKGSLFLELRPKVGDSGKHKDLAFQCTSYSDVLILKDGILWVKINGSKV
jgi:hypothetical protein